MSDSTPIALRPILIPIVSDTFDAIIGWPFADQYISRLLRSDIPQRARFNRCRVWTYRDPQNRLVGFGTLNLCSDYKDLTGGLRHPYIPLLAVNPTLKSLGYGTSIVRHLIDEAVLISFSSQGTDICGVLFLDVYQSNAKAISLYNKNGFIQIGDEVPDPHENDQPYIIMAQSVTISSN